MLRLASSATDQQYQSEQKQKGSFKKCFHLFVVFCNPPPPIQNVIIRTKGEEVKIVKNINASVSVSASGTSGQFAAEAFFDKQVQTVF